MQLMEKIGNGHRIYSPRNDTQTNRNTQIISLSLHRAFRRDI